MRMARRVGTAATALGGALVILLFGAQARAESETHDGFYFNGQIGFGGSSIVVETPGRPDIEFDNGNGDFSVDFGLALNPDVVVFARLWSFVQASPTAETAGVEIQFEDDVSVNTSGLSLGGRYYFMPLNLYAGLSVGAARFTIEEDGDAFAESQLGFAFAVEVGKEWWVSGDWALGVGGRFTHASADDEPAPGVPDGTLTGNALGVLFTATYN